MKKLVSRSLAFLLSVTLCLMALPSAAFASNTPSSWAQSQVNEAIGYGLVPQSIQGDYQSPITRLEFGELMLELFCDYQGGAGYTHWYLMDTTWPTFQDVSAEDSEWVSHLCGVGIMNGLGEGTFGPNQNLTREQAATILLNVVDALDEFAILTKEPRAKLDAAIPRFQTGVTLNYSDSGNISAWAKDGVSKIVGVGIMSGVGNNLFAPKDSVTKEQSIIMALRLFQVLRNGAVYTPQSGTATGSQTGTTTGSQTGTTTPTTGGSFQASFDAIHDGLSYQLDLMEISNATDGKNWPSSDNFPKVDGSLYNLYPDQNVALGYLEAARSEMISAGAVAIEIEINGMMGYTQSSLYRKNQEARERISDHIETARGYLEKAQNAVK